MSQTATETSEQIAAARPPRCHARTDDGTAPCPNPSTWDIVLQCSRCGRGGAGPCCDFHKEQAEDWGIPHPDPVNAVCIKYADLVIAVRL